MKICLKGLRETRRRARLVDRKNSLPIDQQLKFLLGESEEWIRIFKTRVQTAERNRLAKKQASSNPTAPSIQ